MEPRIGRVKSSLIIRMGSIGVVTRVTSPVKFYVLWDGYEGEHSYRPNYNASRTTPKFSKFSVGDVVCKRSYDRILLATLAEVIEHKRKLHGRV